MMIKKLLLFFKILFSAIYLLVLTNNLFADEVFEIEAEKVEYNNEKNIIIAEGNATASNSSGKKIFADKIVYYKNENIIKTSDNSKFLDGQNTLTAKEFLYYIQKKEIEANGNVTLEDEENNKFFFKKFIYNEITTEGIGQNIRGRSSDGSYLQSKKGTINKKENIIKLKDAEFTTCAKIKNKKGEFCPSWSLNSKEIIHDKKNKKISHKHALLKIKKIPVFYAPYISHPDPNVKRQSGFLPPMIKTLSNIGRTVQVPYFWAIDKNKDLTITPVYYFDEHSLIKSSYRQAFKSGFLNIENGYSEGYKRLEKNNRTNGSRNYLFADYKGNFPNLFLKNNKVDFKIQRISQQNFVRVNKIKTSLFKDDIRTLENSFKISSSDGPARFSFRTGIFEDLDVIDSGKYTYYFPDGVYSYNSKKIKNFNTNFNSYFQGKKFSKDQKQAKVRNVILLDSNKFIFRKNGIGTVAKLGIFNNNIYNDNVTNLKNNFNSDSYFTIASDNTFPLAKFSKNSYQLITPRIFIKYTSGTMQDASDNNKILNYSDIFSMNRTNDLDTPEVGASIGHGFDYTYSVSKKNNSSNFLKTSFGLGQVTRNSREKLLPNKSSLNNKSSDISGYLKFNIYGDKNNLNTKNADNIGFLSYFRQNYLSINNSFNLENDISEFVSNNLDLSASYNKFFTSVKFEEKNNHAGSIRNGSVSVKKLIADNYYLNLEGKKNLKNNSSEYFRFGLNFENDCIITSLTLSRDFYFDKDITSSKTLVFGIMIKPFADNFAPDISDLIN
tara:strand:- start:5452 stop:7785 length:2334 start_codon:yes stop_codon:yes gene_type:complete